MPCLTSRRIVIGAILLFSFLALVTILWLGVYVEKKTTSEYSTTVVLIPPGTSFDRVTEILDEKGLIERDVRFKILAYLKGYAGKIRAGEFSLKMGLKPVELLHLLVSAENIQHRVTIAEGLNIYEIADVFADGGWCSRESFIALTGDKKFIGQLDLGPMETLEGFLYPDTYYLTRVPKLSEGEIIVRMVAKFKEVWQKNAPDGADMNKMITLASMVEKETGAAQERPLIAAVFFNRLKRGMRLQSDPTVIYGLDSFSGNLTKNNLRTPTPYNTYTLPSLPRGPICNPGEAAIAAVFHPADEEYLYFVSKNDGSHYFSIDLREHNRAVNLYQRGKRQ